MEEPGASKPVEISCFTDVLCVWAYLSQLRIDELQVEWQGKINLQHHFLSVSGCTARRIGEGWKERGGYDAFGVHALCEFFFRCHSYGYALGRKIPHSAQSLNENSKYQGDMAARSRRSPENYPAAAVNAWSMSAMISSMCSIPTDIRTRSSDTPAEASSVGLS